MAIHHQKIIEKLTAKNEMSEKQLKRRSVERRRRNITMELKEENDRHNGVTENGGVRKSARLNKVTKM